MNSEENMSVDLSQDSSSLSSAWTISPSYAISLTENIVNFGMSWAAAPNDRPIIMGEVSLVVRSGRRIIHGEVHRALLDESMEEYGELWSLMSET